MLLLQCRAYLFGEGRKSSHDQIQNWTGSSHSTSTGGEVVALGVQKQQRDLTSPMLDLQEVLGEKQIVATRELWENSKSKPCSINSGSRVKITYKQKLPVKG